MGPRRSAAALILVLAAAFARAQNEPKASPGPSTDDGAAAAGGAPEAPSASDEAQTKAAVSGAEARKGKFDSGDSEAAAVKNKGSDVQEADLIEKKLASPAAGGDAAGGNMKDPLDAAAGAAAGPPAAPPRGGPAAGGAARSLTPAARASNAIAAPAAQTRSSRAMRRASNAAAAMRNSLPSGESAGPGAGPAGASLAPRPPASKFPDGGSPLPGSAPSSGPNPTEPRTASEVIMASQAGFAGAIRAQGFKIGTGPGGAPAVLAANGRPATTAEISRLSVAIRAEPAALMRRPDFFAVLPRAHFEQLKADYRSNPGAPGAAFQDIGMSAGDRDFRWSASCSALSGGCNPVVREKSYRKGEDVPPEDLDEVWKKTAALEEDEDKDEMGDYTDEDRKEIAEAELAERMMKGGRRVGPNLAGLLAGLGDLADDARGLIGLGGTSERAGSGDPSEAGAGAGGGRSSASLAAGEARGFRAWTVPSPPIERKAARRGAAGAAAGLAAAVFILWRRRRSS